MEWKAGDWVVFDLDVGQIKELGEDSYAIFSDGFCETSGRIADRFRPLTLKNKRTVESFDAYYNRLKSIDGNAGFNYPDISQYFSQLSINAIDAENDDEFYKKANEFILSAKEYKMTIDGVRLFRRAA